MLTAFMLVALAVTIVVISLVLIKHQVHDDKQQLKNVH